LSPVSKSLGLCLRLEAKVLFQGEEQGQDQDLIQWQHCEIYTHICIALFNSRLRTACAVFSSAQLSVAWMPDNSDMAAVDASASVAWATYGCESWTFGKNEETRLDAFEMKRAEKDSAGFVESKVNKGVGS